MSEELTTSQTVPLTETFTTEVFVENPDPIMVSCCPAVDPMFGETLLTPGRTAK